MVEGGVKILLFYSERNTIYHEIINKLEVEGYQVDKAFSNLENRNYLFHEISINKPRRVVVTPQVKIESCENNKEETVVYSVIGILNIVGVSKELGVPCTIFLEEEDKENCDKKSFYGYIKEIIINLIEKGNYLENTTIRII